MTAMDAATKNAGDMIDSLTLLYNRTRQAAITKELHRDRLRRPGAGRELGARTCSMRNQVEGRVVQVIGPVVDVEFPDQHLPAIYNAVEDRRRRDVEAGADRRHHRGRPAPGREPGALHRHAAHRRHGARHEGGRHSALRSRCRSGASTLGRVLDVIGQPVDEQGPGATPSSGGRSTARAVPRASSRPRSRCSRPASRWSTCWSPTPRAARPACSAAPASARPSSSWS